MKTIEEHRTRLREIADYALGHGVEAKGKEMFTESHPSKWGKDDQTKFITACHDGYKIAQNMLIEEIQYYQSLLRDYTKELKECRKSKAALKIEEIENFIKTIHVRISTYSHVADAIAWNLLGGQIHIARRLHIEQFDMKYLDSSNLRHAIEVANSLNKKPMRFALISDLTSFVQIGDLLIRDEDKLGIAELKEGEVNELLEDFFWNIEKYKEGSLKEEFIKKLDKNTVKQMKRMLRQKERAIRAIEVINTDKGIDPVSGNNITVGTPTIPTKGYQEDINKLRSQLDSKIWAYTVVDTCIHIGMYRDEGIPMAGYAIQMILKEQTDNFIVIDWLSITKKLSQPIFAKPFSPEFIVDVLTGKVKIIIGINVDQLIETFNYFGLKTRWATMKETAKAKQESKRKGIFEVNKRGVIITVNGSDQFLGGGILSKIIYDNILPSNIALTLLSVSR
jgi:hypothetical protein